MAIINTKALQQIQWHLAFHAASHKRKALRLTQLGKPCRSKRKATSLEAPQTSDFAEPWSIFDNGVLYEAAFPRDYAAQAQFVEDVYSEFHGGTPSAILELGCGPANHSVELAKRGRKVFALDSHRGVLRYAREKAETEGVDISFLAEEMQDFSLPKDAKVDIALLLFNAMLHLHSNDDARDCFQCAHDALNPGGLLILEVPSLHAIFDGTFRDGDYWEGPVKGQEDVQLVTEYGTDDDEFDPESQVLRKRIGLSLRRGDDITLVGEEFVFHRTWTYQEICLLADLCNFEVVASFGELDKDVPLDHPEASRTVICLQKPDKLDDEDFLNSL